MDLRNLFLTELFLRLPLKSHLSLSEFKGLVGTVRRRIEFGQHGTSHR
jgi:hypothetical protein